MDTKIHVEEEGYIHSTQLINSLAALATAAIAALFLSNLLHTLTFSHSFFSQI
jgi:CBS domain containing-hemolysin-like protein